VWLVPRRPDSCRKAIRRRPSSDLSRDAAPGLPAESVGAGRTSSNMLFVNKLKIEPRRLNLF
jgi:hypothetical protein